MKVTWLGHSAFRLEESTGTTIITDPYGKKVGYEMARQTCDAVTVSHDHFDHNNLKTIDGTYEVLNTVGSFEIKGIHINSFRSYHDREKGSRRGSNIIFKYRIDGVEICHLGDIGEECSPLIAEALGSVDVLLIPVGGRYTLNYTQAMEYVEFLMPNVVIPMHYKTDDCSLDIDDSDDFVDMFDDEDVVKIDSNTIELDRTTFDGERTKLVLLSK